jgi:DNA-binding response OmpR family regulator
MGLPDLDGLEVCRRLRAGGAEVPILVCSARTQIEECVAAFDAGADDYLAKPFALQELRARVQALGRRAPRRARSPAARGQRSPEPMPAAGEAAPNISTPLPAWRVGGIVRQAWSTCTGRLQSSR